MNPETKPRDVAALFGALLLFVGSWIELGIGWALLILGALLLTGASYGHLRESRRVEE